MEKKSSNYILINSLGGGGAERQVSLIATSAKIKEVVCISGPVQYPIPPEKLVLIDTNDNLGIFSKIIAGLNAILYFRKKAKNENVQITAFLTYSFIIGFLIKKITGCRLNIAIRTNMNAYYEFEKGMLIPKWIFKIILTNADAVLCNSKFTQQEIETFAPRATVKTIYNGYDIDKISNLAATTNPTLNEIAAHKKIFVNAGRLIPSKAQHHLLKAFHAANTAKTACLFILGAGPSSEILKKYCTDLGLRYYEEGDDLSAHYDVYFWGFQQNPYQFLRHAEALLFPSYFEGLPNVPIEAIICNVPVILSDCPSGPREILAAESDLSTVASQIEHYPLGMLLPPFRELPNQENFKTELSEIEKYWAIAIKTVIDKKLSMPIEALEDFKESFSEKKSIAVWEHQLAVLHATNKEWQV